MYPPTPSVAGPLPWPYANSRSHAALQPATASGREPPATPVMPAMSARCPPADAPTIRMRVVSPLYVAPFARKNVTSASVLVIGVWYAPPVSV